MIDRFATLNILNLQEYKLNLIFLKRMLQSKSLQQQMLKSYIQNIFNRYDTDRNGTLNVHQMTLFFNQLFRTLQIPTTVTEAQALQAIKSIDQNSDGAVSKEELFAAFKKMLNPQQQQPKNQPNNQNYGYNQQPNQGYNQQPNQYNNYNNGYNPNYNQMNQNPNYNQHVYQGAQNYNNPNQNYNQNYNMNQGYGNNMNQSYPINGYNPNMHQSQPQQYQVPPQYNSSNPQNNPYNPYR